MKFLLSLSLALILNFPTFSQKYWVFFKDKDPSGFNPSEFFHPAAIERRKNLGLPEFDFKDLPVNPNYIGSVSALADSITATSRWFNAVCIYSSAENAEKIGHLSFVQKIQSVLPDFEGQLCGDDSPELNSGEWRLLRGQIERMKGQEFHANDIKGKGVRIAILDAGFRSYKNTPSLEHLIKNKKIVGTYDFVRNSKDVDLGHSHGTMVLNCIGGMTDSLPVGLATEAEYLLARTEKGFSEKLKEEENWIEALEWADQSGAHIINSSLGYTGRRYFPEDLDGKSGLISRAASIAASKGILVVNSAGNEGADNWKKLGAPGDADSILTVGAINPYTGIHASWSSYGPSADGRTKPNVSAYGYAMVNYGSSWREVTGTSFSSPLIAGFAACVKQLHQEFNVYDLLCEIEHSGDLYPYYDYVHGYGVPQATYFLQGERELPARLFLEQDGPFIKIIIPDSCYSLAEPVLPAYSGFDELINDEDITEFHMDDAPFDNSSSYVFTQLPDYLFIHASEKDGLLRWYKVVSVHSQQPFKLETSSLNNGDILRVFYKGSVHTLEIRRK